MSIEENPAQANDKAYQEEQAHLTATYAKLKSIEAETERKIKEIRAQATKDMGDMRDELALDFSSDDMAMETLAEYQSMNGIIEGYNRAMEVNMDRYKKTRQLLPRAYFAKVSLQFKPGAEPRDIYLGTVGMTDEDSRHFIVDWRSPVAETYYNQEIGPTSYKVDDRTINCDLKLRRQFDIDHDKLGAYFDTTVAIEDPLLLSKLAERHSEKLQAITATIQREQNKVIRHDDVEVLLVNGIAGSGKTSVLLQRIAYLFYQYRDTLEPDQVHLFTPNPVFGKYIDNVLPDMGESNPQITTWNKFFDARGLTGRGMDTRIPVGTLNALEAAVPSLKLTLEDFNDIEYNGRALIKASQVRNIVEHHPNAAPGKRLAALVNEGLYERLENKLKSLAASEEIMDIVDTLPVTEQIEIFDQQISTESEEDLKKWSERYVEAKWAGAIELIDDYAWLNVSRIGARLTGDTNMPALQWFYLRLLLTGDADRAARFVMIDEVQDYTEAQLMVLSRYFSNAHFLLLGDEHQAIKEGTATFPQIAALFKKDHEVVDECRLMTSYRSTPEITSLFCGLLDESERVLTSSVQRAGTKPDIRLYPNRDEWGNALKAAVAQAAEEQHEGGLTAVIGIDKQSTKLAAKVLGNAAVLVKNDMQLQADGVVVLDLALAKGLEFDHVIIPDADAAHYQANGISKRRLYTALSRATQKVTVLAQGELTPLLK
jgi:DNA helicase II / ATP-dependent DNA helicase PcrA